MVSQVSKARYEAPNPRDQTWGARPGFAASEISEKTKGALVAGKGEISWI
jgi:hypothetical protein